MKAALSKLLNIRAEDVAPSSEVAIHFPEGRLAFPVKVEALAPGMIAEEWIKKNFGLFESSLDKRGAILLRGFGIDSVQRFGTFMAGFDQPLLEYRQRSSPRFEVAKNVYHSTTYPADQSIKMHSENSYASEWAGRIVFCCIEPADVQGETPIADNRLVLDNLTSELREKFLRKGVRYVRNMSPGIGLQWQEVFQTQDRGAVEKECEAGGMAFEWGGEDRLSLSWTTPAMREHPRTGEMLWFNHGYFFNKYALPEEALASFRSDEDLAFNTYFGDGTEISKDEIDAVGEAYRQATVVFPWRKGDVLYLDNMLMAHGRMPYEGNRKIIVSML